jgi:hypothetical protein
MIQTRPESQVRAIARMLTIRNDSAAALLPARRQSDLETISGPAFGRANTPAPTVAAGP